MAFGFFEYYTRARSSETDLQLVDGRRPPDAAGISRL